MEEGEFVTESIQAIATAETVPGLDRTAMQRVTALVFDGGTLTDVRALAAAWRDRNTQLLHNQLDQQ